MNALILVDIQNDFLPGGALAVPDGDAVIAVANHAIYSNHFDVIVATQDWHPADHGSFAANHPGQKPGNRIVLDGLDQILWPVHCVECTLGAAFAARLAIERVHRVFRKGTDPQIDSYSGFFDNGHRKSTGLGEFLKTQKIEEVSILGLATDYCVKYTALDARELGLRVTLISDGCRAVNLQAGDDQRAIEEMHAAGVELAAEIAVQSR